LYGKPGNSGENSNGSFWWNVFGKKVIPSEVFLFLAFSGIPGNFCTVQLSTITSARVFPRRQQCP